MGTTEAGKGAACENKKGTYESVKGIDMGIKCHIAPALFGKAGGGVFITGYTEIPVLTYPCTCPCPCYWG